MRITLAIANMSECAFYEEDSIGTACGTKSNKVWSFCFGTWSRFGEDRGSVSEIWSHPEAARDEDVNYLILPLDRTNVLKSRSNGL